ncbi:MAG: LptF/LptG family permease [Bacteroidetes bacterium]|nr:LptF/LptG family permease [Bacteroidota bacterium]
MKILDWYIVRKFLGTFFFAILILAVIACVIDLSEKLNDFSSNHAPLLAILNYYKNFVPHISALLYPLFIFIATIFFTSKLAYKSEIVAMLATGMPFNRFLRPYVIGAAFLGSLALLVNHWVVPMANKSRLAFEDKYVHEKVTNSDRNVHMQIAPGLLVYVENYDYANNMGYHFTAEKVEGNRLREKLMADHVSYDSTTKMWHLYQVVIRKNDSLKESLENAGDMLANYPFTPKDLRENSDVKEALTTPQLNHYIAVQRMHGNDNLNIYYVEKYRRTAQPFAGFLLSLIGACIASRRIRGGSGFHLALGIAISAVYMLILQFSTTFSTKAGLNPFIAVWIPNLAAGIVAYFVYRRQASGR